MDPLARSQPPPAPGWYADPWGVGGTWRWWDGRMWTPETSAGSSGAAGGRKPRLPAWLSVPVILGAIVMVPTLLLSALPAPLAIPLGLVPLLIVAPAIQWLDRVEPEPRPARLHAFLWGASAAAGVAVIVNSLVAIALGDVVATVVSAPLVEEGMKGLAVLWAVRRREVDGVVDGIVYAAWAGLGFAVVEDVLYFAAALGDGTGAVVFVLRGLLTPFAHPLFTAWIGMAVGLAVRRGTPVGPAALGGGVIAVLTHALWNGSLVGAGTAAGGLFLLGTIVLFVVLFFSVVIALFRLRRREEQRFGELVGWLAQRYGMSPAEVAPFGRLGDILRTRKALPPADRARFDAAHAALARLALLHDRPGGADGATEARLVDQLQRARYGRV